MTSRKFRRESEQRFLDRERALREKSGKPVEAPQPPKKADDVPVLNVSEGVRE
jgi:hypothetical protein